MDYFAELCKLKALRPDWTILLGPEARLADAHALGGDGGVSGGANVAPRLFVDCHRGLSSNDEALVAETLAKITIFQEMYEIGKYPSRLHQGDEIGSLATRHLQRLAGGPVPSLSRS